MSRASDRYFQKWFDDDEQDLDGEDSATVVMSGRTKALAEAALAAKDSPFVDFDDDDEEDNPTVVFAGSSFGSLDPEEFALADDDPHWLDPEAAETVIRRGADEPQRGAAFVAESTPQPALRAQAAATVAQHQGMSLTVPLGLMAGLFSGVLLSGMLVAAVAFLAL